MLRNPAKRTISHYYHVVKHDGENMTFEEALDLEFSKISSMNNVAEVTKNPMFREYVTQSLYIYFLKKWLDIFPREQILILKTEDLNQNTDLCNEENF